MRTTEIAQYEALTEARITRRANIEWLLIVAPTFAGLMWLIPRIPESAQPTSFFSYLLALPIVYIWRRHKARQRVTANDRK